MTNTKYWADHFDVQMGKHPDDSIKALNFSNPKLMNQVHEEVLSCIDFSRIEPESRLLDTGCGTGELLCKLIQGGAPGKKFEYHATDISRRMLQKARDTIRKTFNTHEPFCRFSLMSVDSMGFADGFFDLILASESLQYTDPYLAILDLIRMTQKGGQIVISIPNQASVFIQKARERHQGRFNGLDFEKALDLITPKVSVFKAKPLIFAENQDQRPYLKKRLEVQLSAQDIKQANRFVIHLIV